MAGWSAPRTCSAFSIQCFAITCAVSVLWLFFGTVSLSATVMVFIGGLGKAMFAGIAEDGPRNIPDWAFSLFQLTFAIITPALVVGAFAERMRFGACLLFAALWFLAVYATVCHWVWGGGWVAELGIKDFRRWHRRAHHRGRRCAEATLVLGARRGSPTGRARRTT